MEPSHLERVFQPHQEWEADRLKNPLLVQRVLYLLQLDYLRVRERWKEKGGRRSERDKAGERGFSKLSNNFHFRKVLVKIQVSLYGACLISVQYYYFFTATSFMIVSILAVYQ